LQARRADPKSAQAAGLGGEACSISKALKGRSNKSAVRLGITAPLQGFRFNGVAFPGLRPGLTYSAPAGLRSVRIRYLERTGHSRNKLAGSDQREENGGSPFRVGP